MSRARRLDAALDIVAVTNARWHAALEDAEAEPAGPIRDHIEAHDKAVRERAEFVRDHWHRVAEQRGQDLNAVLAENIRILELAMGRDSRVRALCAEWDRLSKGESPTTRAIRAALDGRAS